MRFASSELQKTIELRASIRLQKPIESIELLIALARQKLLLAKI